MRKNFSQQYEFIYDIFCSVHASKDTRATLRGFCDFLGISLGKRQAWDERGQWPSAEDIEILHKKMGFSYHWLITGEGDPFDGEPPKPAAPPVPDQSDEIARLRAELDEANRLNRKLVTRLLIDGAGDKNGSTSTVGKTADGQR